MAVKKGEKALVLNDTYHNPKAGEEIKNFRIKRQYMFKEPQVAQTHFRPRCFTTDGGEGHTECFINDGNQLCINIDFMDINWRIDLLYRGDDSNQLFTASSLHISHMTENGEENYDDLEKEYDLGFSFHFEGEQEELGPILDLFETGSISFEGIFTAESTYESANKESLYWNTQKIGLEVDPSTVLNGVRYFSNDGICKGTLGSTTDISSLKTINSLMNSIDTSKKVDCTRLFEGYKRTDRINDMIKYLDTSACTNFTLMFANNETPELDLSNFNTSKGANFYGMFIGMPNVTRIDMSNFDFSKITVSHGLQALFEGCTNLREIVFPSNSISTPSSFNSICANNSSLENFSLGNFGITRTSFTMESGFAGCSNLRTVDLSNLFITGSISILSAFRYCSNLELIDLRNVDTIGRYDFAFDGVPSSCIMIVKDATAKASIRSPKIRIMTVDEYNAQHG